MKEILKPYRNYNFQNTITHSVILKYTILSQVLLGDVVHDTSALYLKLP